MENLHKGHRERLRQSYIENGPDGMHEHQLLELLLTYAIPRRDTNPIAHRLLDKSAFGSLWEVLSAGPKELMAVEGIGESAAVLLSLVGAMGRRAKAQGHGGPKEKAQHAGCRHALLQKPAVQQYQRKHVYGVSR